MANVPVLTRCDLLADYLGAVRDRRWRPGEFDCGVFMADWVKRLTGIDPIADVRGRYDSERQFLRILRREGGFEVACAARLTAIGFRETKTAAAGDIVVVLAPYTIRRGKLQRRPTGALCVAAGQHAVVTSDIGLVIAGADRLPPRQAFSYA
jgi:hypothetical protein